MAKKYICVQISAVRSVFWILFLVVLASCFNQGDCLITSTNLAKLDLMDKTSGKSRTTKFLKIDEELEGVQFLAQDSTYTGNSLQLPLNPKRTACQFVFLTSDSVTFHLNVRYSTYTRVIAVECGAYLYYDNLGVDSTDFDHYKILAPQLFKPTSGVPATNLQVYF